MNPSAPNNPPPRRHWRTLTSTKGVTILFLVLTIACMVLIAPHALPIILLDLLTAILVFAPPMLAGLWLPRLLGLGHLPRQWQFYIGGLLGIGFFSLIVFGMGLAGLLQRPLWIALLAIMSALGVCRLRTMVPMPRRDQYANAHSTDLGATRLLWLCAAPFLANALLAASNPPGLIWSEEGFGYDVLEYHLQIPKEYLVAGRIAYAPHNVYANFPSNVEMIYLVSMILRGDPVESGTTANVIHLLLAVLTVWGAWLTGSLFSPRAGMIAGVLLATCGWLPYLSGLAYVENGVLAFAMLAVTALLQAHIGRAHAIDENQDLPKVNNLRHSWLAVCGLAAGLACGCKYTAVPMIAIPLCLGAGIAGGSAAKRCRASIIVIACTLATLSPWLVKNYVHTGNPVFPLAHNILQTYPPGWDAASANRWDRGHQFIVNLSRPKDASPSNPAAEASFWQLMMARLTTAWHHVPGDQWQRFGPAILLLPIVCLCHHCSGASVSTSRRILLAMLAIQSCVWLFATHVYARFAVPILIPLCLLGALGAMSLRSQFARLTCTLCLLGGVAVNLTYVFKLHDAESAPGVPASVIYEEGIGPFEHYAVVNRLADHDARVLLLGDARAFYYLRDVTYSTVFNTNPFIAYVNHHEDSESIVTWLRESGFTHVLIDWSEIARLRRTYGFSGKVERELFDKLVAAGLRLQWQSEAGASDSPAIQLFSVASR